MGVRDFKVSQDEVSLLLPLEPNRNHKGTLFGGSLYSAGALACYGLFLSSLAERGIQNNNIVIAEGNIRYLKPVTRDIEIKAGWESAEAKDRFFQVLLSKKKARVIMVATGFENEELCFEFKSSFATWL